MSTAEPETSSAGSASPIARGTHRSHWLQALPSFKGLPKPLSPPLRLSACPTCCCRASHHLSASH
eukprot:6214637-Pleurochrysis_carterae.AAC.1